MNRETHKQRVHQFLKSTIGQYDHVLKFDIQPNSEEDDRTAYEIRITNTTNDTKHFLVLQSDGIIVELLKGEDFYKCNPVDFFAHLFICEFITMVEA